MWNLLQYLVKHVLSSFKTQFTHFATIAKIKIAFSLVLETREKCPDDPEVNTTDTYECRWYDEDSESWRSDGCMQDGIVVQADGDITTVKCVCEHLTAFAILQNVALFDGMQCCWVQLRSSFLQCRVVAKKIAWISKISSYFEQQRHFGLP